MQDYVNIYKPLAGMHFKRYSNGKTCAFKIMKIYLPIHLIQYRHSILQIQNSKL